MARFTADHATLGSQAFISMRDAARRERDASARSVRLAEATRVPLSRRTLLAGGASCFAAAQLPRPARAGGGRDPRFIVIILRGALDGLSAVGPVGDPNYAALHGAISLAPTGEHAALPLDSFFALHPAMPSFAGLYAAKQAAILHAVATPYRDRSHFDGQDVLESGFPHPGFTQSGWLNRTLECLPKGGRVNPRGGLAIGAATPLVLRGRAPILGWAPPAIAAAGDDLAERVLALYQAKDPLLHERLAEGLMTDRIARREMRGGFLPARGNIATAMRTVARGAARLIAADDGPRIAALSFDGWDTHANEGGASGRLAFLLNGLDSAFDELHHGLGPKWRDTAIVAVTEFGRTARINGTAGTDHGTATVAFLAGGAIKGGRVLGDWPGLSPANLYQNRDLRPTSDLRSLLKGLLAAQFDIPAGVLANRVFPQSGAVAPMSDLIA